MLNCVNSLEPQSMNSGIEHAALMISEEKTQHDSRKLQFNLTSVPFFCLILYIYIWFVFCVLMKISYLSVLCMYRLNLYKYLI